jgi:hypothetical protein
VVKVQLPAGYPEAAPLVSAQLPIQLELPWQSGASNLETILKQHEGAIAALQDLWACLEDLDRSVSAQCSPASAVCQLCPPDLRTISLIFNQQSECAPGRRFRTSSGKPSQ